MAEEYLLVEDNPGLVREKATHAVINTDYEAYQKYMEKKKHLQEKEESIIDLKQEVNDLKDLVKQLIDNRN
jgi:hypothetical protein